MVDHKTKPVDSDDGIVEKEFPKGCLIFLIVFFFLLGLGMGEAMVNG